MSDTGFDKEYSRYSKKNNINSDPDNPKHFYDYRKLFKDTGKIETDKEGHLPSKYKKKGHPRMVIDGINTKTGKKKSVGKKKKTK